LAIGSDSKKPNISETVLETFTKLSGFLEFIPTIPCAKYGGDLTTQFWGRGGKVETLTPISPKREVRELEIFCAVGGLRVLKNKILASGPPVKGGPEKNNFDFKKFLRN